MSSNKYFSTFIEEAFSQRYNFDVKTTPHGISLDELLKSTAFLESTPNNFIFSCPGPKNLTFSQQFEEYIKFSKENPGNPPIQNSIFPLFCHIVMKLKKNEDQNLYKEFVEKYLKCVPENDYEEAQNFVTNEEFFNKMASLFSTQRYKVKCDDDTQMKISSFLHKSGHSQLFLLYTSNIILIPDRVQQTDNVTESRFPLSSSSALSIVQARINSASFAAISKEEPVVYACTNDQNIIRIDTSNQQAQLLYKHSTAVTTLSLSSRSKVLLSADLCGNISLWSKSAVCHMSPKFMQIICSSFAPHGGFFGIGSGNGLIHLYDTRKQHLHRILSGYQEPVTNIAFHPNCAYLGSLSIEPPIRIWDLRLAETCRLFKGQPQKNDALSFSPDGKLLAVFDSELQVFDIGTQQLLFEKALAVSDVTALHFSMDSRFIYAVSKLGTVVACEVATENRTVSDIIKINERVISSELLHTDLRVVTTFEDCEQMFE